MTDPKSLRRHLSVAISTLRPTSAIDYSLLTGWVLLFHASKALTILLLDSNRGLRIVRVLTTKNVISTNEIPVN